MPGPSRLTQRVRHQLPLRYPAVVRYDVSEDYAQAAVFFDRPGKATLWIESAQVELHVVLSPAQVALLARSTVAFALGAVDEANVEACYTPTISERDAKPLDDAYRAMVTAMESYRKAVERDRDRRTVEAKVERAQEAAN